jgi:hypothetical protein
MTGSDSTSGILSRVPAQGARHAPTTSRPSPEDAARITGFLREHPSWSAFWDKQFALWRVAEDDPDSSLYAASADAGIVIAYMAYHSSAPSPI